MCSRYFLVIPQDIPAIQQPYFADLKGRHTAYNVVPGNFMPICRITDGRPELILARWGLTHDDGEDQATDSGGFNVDAETVAALPDYQDAYRSRRCLVPASGYYERPTAPGGESPYYFMAEETPLLCFAGLWDVWRAKEGTTTNVFTIVVRSTYASSEGGYSCMPVILQPENYLHWLTDCGPIDLLLSAPNIELLKIYPVNRKVNATEIKPPSPHEKPANTAAKQ